MAGSGHRYARSSAKTLFADCQSTCLTVPLICADANKVYFCRQEGAIEKLLSYIDSKYSPTIRYYAISSVWNFASSGKPSSHTTISYMSRIFTMHQMSYRELCLS